MHPFLGEATIPLWRLSLPAAAPVLDLGEPLIEWGGALRWVRTSAAPDEVRAAAQRAGGHATLFRGGDRAGAVFHPPGSALMTLHRRLKEAFDPHGIFNPGRLYEDF
jgi:glycolate oxidase FAD binding subunit